MMSDILHYYSVHFVVNNDTEGKPVTRKVLIRAKDQIAAEELALSYMTSQRAGSKVGYVVSVTLYSA